MQALAGDIIIKSVHIVSSLVLLASSLLVRFQTTYAHTLVTDRAQTSGAIVHIAPDDDPIIGEPSTIFIDLTNQPVSPENHYFYLSAQDTAGSYYPIPTTFDGGVISGNFNFPMKTTYTITLTAVDRATDEKTEFSHTQEAVRLKGSGSSLFTRKYAGILLLGIGLIGGMYFAFFNKKQDTKTTE